MDMDAIYEVALYEFTNRTGTQNEQLDRFRLALEPYIYHYLIEKCMPTLNKVWETYFPPYKSDNAFVLVERRPHPNFEFILKNMAWACPTMSVYLFCSDVNEGFIRAILKDKASHYHILPVFKGLKSREEGKIEYNHFLTSAHCYRMIHSKYIMTVQMDVFIRKKLPSIIFATDYYGNPWGWDLTLPGGGGITVRRVDKMIELCEKYGTCGLEAEDSWISKKMVEMGGVFPNWDMRAYVCMESVRVDHPICLHQFWTFLHPYFKMSKEEVVKYWSHLLTLVEE
jgi:hypothetical protein